MRDEIMPHPVTATIDGQTYTGGICFGPRATHVAMVQGTNPGDQPAFFWGADRFDAMRQGSDEVARREARGRAATARLFPVDN